MHQGPSTIIQLGRRAVSCKEQNASLDTQKYKELSQIINKAFSVNKAACCFVIKLILNFADEAFDLYVHERVEICKDVYDKM